MPGSGRSATHVGRRPVGDDPAGFDQQRPVAALGKVEVVGDQHQLGEREQQVRDRAGVAQVEQRRRLVGDQHVGVGGQHPGERQQLPLAARERVHAAVGEVGQPEPVQRLQRRDPALAPCPGAGDAATARRPRPRSASPAARPGP